MSDADRRALRTGSDAGLVVGGVAPLVVSWALVFGVVLTAVLWFACLYSLYVPILHLGATVG